MSDVKSNSPSAAKLKFVGVFSDREESEARDRGYLSHVLVDINDQFYPVVFYDPIRLKQDLEMSQTHGRAFVADPAMIVLPDITIDAMQDAVQRLCDEGFFRRFVPVTKEQLAVADPYEWPP